MSDGWFIDDLELVAGPVAFEPSREVESFEAGWGDWVASGGAWEIGEGPAHHGRQVAGTVLAGNYTDGIGAVNGTSSRLISPEFVLPAANQHPRLRFWHAFAFNSGDYGELQISAEGGAWETLQTYSSTAHGVWSRAGSDLEPYAGKAVRLGFLFHSENIRHDCCEGNYEVAGGWYLDELEVATGTPVFRQSESFEAGWGDWVATGGAWEIGEGPAHHGRQVAGTVLAGNYTDGIGAVNGTSSRLISPAFIVPAADQHPRLRFWHTFAFNSGDYGELQISAEGGAWETLQTSSSTAHGVWSRAGSDLEPCAGKAVRLGFFFHSENIRHDCCEGNYEVAGGWYLDELEVVTGIPVFHNPESFEAGWGDWVATGGAWEIGEGPAHHGRQAAGTVLAGNYTDGIGAVNGTSSRLISPAFIVPAADQHPRLRFWHTFAFNSGDYGELQISAEGGAWETLQGYSSTAHGVWSRAGIDLGSYAGKGVRLGFFFPLGEHSSRLLRRELRGGWWLVSRRA